MLGRNLITSAAGNAAEAVDNSYDIEFASFDGDGKNWIVVYSQDTASRGLSFKTDGTKMYHTGVLSDKVYEYNLSTAWDVATAVYSQSFSVSAQDGVPMGLTFKTDGSKMYVVGNSNDSIYEYDLDVDWDISSASYNQTFDVSAKATNPTGVFFRNDGGAEDGKQMYVVGSTSDSVHEYSLSTAWDISTATFDQSFSVSSQESVPTSLFFRNDGGANSGKTMYIAGSSGDDIGEYSLSTAWDISTASYTDNLSITAETTSPTGLFFKPDGSEAFVFDTTYDRVFQLSLSTDWDISTGTFSYPTTDYFELTDNVAVGLFFKSDGSKMFVAGSGSDVIREYSLSTAWAIETASFTTSFSVSSQDTSPSDIFFRNDGSADDGKKMYVLGFGNDRLYAYDLTTAWDISTASFDESVYVGTEAPVPTGLAFASDGSKFYVSCNNTDKVHEYDLSTDWDISTETFNQSVSVSQQASAPQGIELSPTGDRLYVVDVSGDSIHQYTLNPNYDISSASFDVTFTPEEGLNGKYYGSMQSLRFKSDGSKLFVVDSSLDAAWAFTIS
ncbi:MAG: hypothetical protein EBV86_02465 [Marivivens sp.]|nr:hypothetical protein [Marivivens sp.]